MKLVNTQEFDPRAEDEAFFERFEHRPAVFLLFSDSNAAPYIGRTRDLQRRLRRILRRPEGNSKLLNLREITRRIDYQYAASSFEMQWMVYHLNRQYYPLQYRARMRLRPPALLKLNLRNRFPRLYPTRRISRDGSIYYGPFPSRAAAERLPENFSISSRSGAALRTSIPIPPIRAAFIHRCACVWPLVSKAARTRNTAKKSSASLNFWPVTANRL